MSFNFILLVVTFFVVAKTFLNALLNNILKSCHALALTHPRVSVNNSPGRRHFALPEFLTDSGGEGVAKCAGLPRPATLVEGLLCNSIRRGNLPASLFQAPLASPSVEEMPRACQAVSRVEVLGGTCDDRFP